jgi:hypothetical protein
MMRLKHSRRLAQSWRVEMDYRGTLMLPQDWQAGIDLLGLQ